MSDKITVAEAIRRFDAQFGHVGKCLTLRGDSQTGCWFYDDADNRVDLRDGERHSDGDPVAEVIHARYGTVMVCGLFDKSVKNEPV